MISDEEIYNTYLKYKSIFKIQLNIKIHKNKLKRILSNNNVDILFLEKEFENDITCEYLFNNISRSALAKKYKLKTIDVTNILIKNNVKIRKHGSWFKSKYTFDEMFFEMIDTAEKAYILGLIYADGCITNPRGKSSWVCRI